jgi:toxin ParE1/3/4
MAYKLIWSPASRNDLRDLVRYISFDSPSSAQAFASRLMKRTDHLQQHPEIGRMLRELRGPAIREIIFRPYRIIYRIDHSQELVEISRVWHSARGAPEIFEP